MLMALSNTHGWLVLATGNKSEMAVGYATLYGDMVGGYALLKDVFKTDVFRLARHLNERAGRELIPVSTIERPPTRGAAGRAARRPVAPAVRAARPGARGVHRARPLARGAASSSSTRRSSTRRSRSSTAPSTSAARRRRGQAPPARLRPRLAHADHQPLAGLKAPPVVALPPGRGFQPRPSRPGTSSRSARNQRRRSSHGTAAFAGDVDGSTKRSVSASRSSWSPCAGRPPNGPR